MDEAGHPARAAYARVKESVHWSEALEARIVARVAAGESVRALAREAGFPRPETVTRWGRERPAFREAMGAAKDAAGSRLKGSAPSWCEETAEAICRRLAEGEGLAAICRDAAMPARNTVQRWRSAHPAFDAAYLEARELSADWVFEEGWRLMMEATPETAYLTKVRLGHLRWHAGKILPKRYGTVKAVEPEAAGAAAAAAAEAAAGAAAQAVTTVVMRTFRIDPITWESREDPDTPDELLWSKDAAGNITRPPPEELAAREARREDFRRAFAEAKGASLKAGIVPNGSPHTCFWPDWFRVKHPRDWIDEINAQAAKDRRAAECRARFADAPELVGRTRAPGDLSLPGAPGRGDRSPSSDDVGTKSEGWEGRAAGEAPPPAEPFEADW